MEFSNNIKHFCFICAVTEIPCATFQRLYERGSTYFKNELFILPTSATTAGTFDLQDIPNKCGHNVQFYYHFRY